jgi:hypothetical protein
VSQAVFLSRVLFSDNWLSCVKYAVIHPALYKSNVADYILQYSKYLVERFLSSLGGDAIPLTDRSFEMCRVYFASPHHLNQIFRHFAAAERDWVLSVMQLSLKHCSLDIGGVCVLYASLPRRLDCGLWLDYTLFFVLLSCSSFNSIFAL